MQIINEPQNILLDNFDEFKKINVVEAENQTENQTENKTENQTENQVEKNINLINENLGLKKNR